MRRRFLDFIRCPNCRSEFEVSASEEKNEEIISGKLTCSKCRHSYPIISAIPRFIDNIIDEKDLENVYAHSFGYQWTTYDWIREEDEFEFQSITDISLKDFKGKIAMDAGCGGGRMTRVIAPHCGEIVAFDYSIACERAYEVCSAYGNTHFAQCDINRPIFKSGMFDFVFSHGVLHPTPNTRKSFERLLPLVKPRGLLYVAVFDKAILPLRLLDGLWRSLLNKLPLPMLDKVCGGLSYLHLLPFAGFWKRFFWFSLQKTHQIRKCCLVDWYGPKYHHEHTPEEVIGWFRDGGFSNARYINAWPYCPAANKYVPAGMSRRVRLGLLLGVIGTKDDARDHPVSPGERGRVACIQTDSS